MNRILLTATLCLPAAALSHAVDFQKDVVPIFKTYCYKCHSEEAKKEKGKVVLDNLKRLAEKFDGKVITAGDPEKSTFYKNLLLPTDDDDHMPPEKDKQPKEADIAMIKQWIAEGAKFVGGGSAPAPAVAVAPAPAPGAAPAPDAPAGGLQTWTNTAGKAIKATKLRLEGDSVVLQREDNVVFLVPLASLSADSQAQAKK